MTLKELAIMRGALPAVDAAANSRQNECWPGDVGHDDNCTLADHALAAAAVKDTEGLEWVFYSWSSAAEWFRQEIEEAGQRAAFHN